MPETNGKITEARPRKFVFNGMQLADPDPKMMPQKVAEFHSLLHAELTNVTIKGSDEDCGRIRRIQIHSAGRNFPMKKKNVHPISEERLFPAFSAGADERE